MPSERGLGSTFDRRRAPSSAGVREAENQYVDMNHPLGRGVVSC